MKRGSHSDSTERGHGDEPDDDTGARIDFAALKPGVTKRFPSYLERYCTQKFHLVPPPGDSTGAPCEDQWVCQHSNKLVLVGVAQTHAIFAQKGAAGAARNIAAIDWTSSSSGADRQNMKVTGKGGRKGGVWVNPDSVLCTVTMDDGSTYRLRACIKGVLVEVNPRLVGEAGCALLQQKPATEGYLAVIRPKFEEARTCTAALATREEYCSVRGVPLDSTFRDPAPARKKPKHKSTAAAAAADENKEETKAAEHQNES